jgi:T5orf172 domain
MIYFVRLESGSIKIGFTDNLEQRLSGLVSYYDGPVVLVATVPGGRKIERAIHDRFVHLRFDGTEQFRPAPEVFAFLDLPMPDGIDPDAIKPTPCAHTYVQAKIDVNALTIAKKAAALKGKTLADYISDVVMEYAPKDIWEAAAPFNPNLPKS